MEFINHQLIFYINLSYLNFYKSVENMPQIHCIFFQWNLGYYLKSVLRVSNLQLKKKTFEETGKNVFCVLELLYTKLKNLKKKNTFNFTCMIQNSINCFLYKKMM